MFRNGVILNLKLSVIIPCYNEKSTIEEIVRRVRNVGLVHEIVLVDDGSTDGTRDVLAAMEGHILQSAELIGTYEKQ